MTVIELYHIIKRINNDNEKLIIEFKNNINSKSTLQKQDELFEELFGKWQDGLDESMKNEKERVGRVVYSTFNIIDQQLILTLEEYKNNDIDSLENDKKYIIEEVDNRGKAYYFDIGTYHGMKYEDDETLLIIDLDKRVQMGKVRPLLRKHCPVMEDFRANISAYKRQHYAIRALHDDNYSSKNLKDILLNLDEPTYTPFLQNIIFSKDTLNSSQKEAIRKALYSDSISLIQGPPGTGKSQTITNIIAQGLADGKKILFVSEKMAALEVVHRRLEEVHLADFCLALHSHKANKKEILEQLGQNLNLKHIKVKDEEIAKLTRLDVLRDGLKCYVEDIHKTIMPIEMSLYEVYGAIAELQDLPFVRLTLDGIGDYSKDEVNRMGLLVENLEMTRGSLGEKWYKNPWQGITISRLGNVQKEELKEKMYNNALKQYKARKLRKN